MWWKFEKCHLENKLFKYNNWNLIEKQVEECSLISRQQYEDGINWQKEESSRQIIDLKTSVPLTFKYRYKYTSEEYVNVKQTPDIAKNLSVFYSNNIDLFKNNSLKTYLNNLSNKTWNNLSNFVTNITDVIDWFQVWTLKERMARLLNWSFPINTPEIDLAWNNFYTKFNRDYNQNKKFTLETVDSFNSMVLLFGYQFIWKKFDNPKINNFSTKPHLEKNKRWNEKEKIEGYRLRWNVFEYIKDWKQLMKVDIFPEETYIYNGAKAIRANYLENYSGNARLAFYFIKELKKKMKSIWYTYIVMKPYAYIPDPETNISVNNWKKTHKEAWVLTHEKLLKFYGLLWFYQIPHEKAIWNNLWGKWVVKN